MGRLEQCYINWHLARVFFEDFAAWKQLAAATGLPSTLTQDTYDQLFKGTNADVYIPLWASACIGNEDILLNETTLAVIRFYKKYGYAWVPMDGNPPDYIGQQCRFLEYLTSCYRKKNDEELLNAIEQFIDQFLSSTVQKMAAALSKMPDQEDTLLVMRLLRQTISTSETFIVELPDELVSRFDSFGWSLQPEIPLERAHITTHASFGDCGNKCKMLAQVQEGCVLSVFPDNSVPGKKFFGCARGRAYRQTFLSSHRLRYPMERVGERGSGVFRRISWEEAAEKVGDGIRESRRKYGPGSRFVMSASGVSALVRGDRFVKHLLSIDGGYLQYYNSYSTACANYVLPYVYGTSTCGSVEEDLLQTKLLILWGHNPVATQWGDRQMQILAQLKRLGTKMIVIDPRRSETARRFADLWIPLRPGTDGALADAMAYVIWKEELQDQDFMDRFCQGFDEAHMPDGIPPHESYHSYVFGYQDGVEKTPQWAEAVTGVPAAVIEQVACEYATTKPACLMPGLGPQRTMNGEQNCRSYAMLACLTGNVGISGGGSGGYACRKGHSSPQFVPKQSPYKGEIPTFLWSRAVDQPALVTAENGLRGVAALESGIKVLFNLASGILLNQHSNINDTVRILREPDKLELLVVSDILMTPGARFADLLLPAVSFFETENVVPPWTEADYLLYNEQAIPPLFGGRFEYEWIKNAAEYLDYKREFLLGRETLHDWVRELYEAHRAIEPELPAFDQFRKMGCHIYQNNPYTIAFQENIQNGAPFQTPSGKIEIFSPRLYKSKIPGIPCYTPCIEGVSDPLRKKYPLQLIGYHTRRRCHSIHDSNPMLEAMDPPAVWIHPADAALRGIVDGQLVEVFNARGCMRIPAKITEDIVRGAVAVSEGGWYTPDQKNRDTRGSINVLTMTHCATPLANGNPQHTNLVQIQAANK